MDAMGGDIYRRMDDLREDVNIVGAHAAALSGLHPIDYITHTSRLRFPRR